MRLRILGIDPGSTATGYGVVERQGGDLVHAAHGVLRPPRAAPLAERLAFLRDGLLAVVECHHPEVAVVEQVFVSRNPRSAIVLGQARGAVLVALGEVGLPVAEYAAREVKQSVVGQGGAEKAQVQKMVARLLGLAEPPATDAADALAVAICHAGAGPLAAQGVGRGRGRRRTLRALARHLS